MFADFRAAGVFRQRMRSFGGVSAFRRAELHGGIRGAGRAGRFARGTFRPRDFASGGAEAGSRGDCDGGLRRPCEFASVFTPSISKRLFRVRRRKRRVVGGGWRRGGFRTRAGGGTNPPRLCGGDRGRSAGNGVVYFGGDGAGGVCDNEVEKPAAGVIAAHDYDGVVAEFRARTAQTLTFRQLPANSEFVLEALSPEQFCVVHARRACRADAALHGANHGDRGIVWTRAARVCLGCDGDGADGAGGFGGFGAHQSNRRTDDILCGGRRGGGLEPLVFRRLPGGDHSILDVLRDGEVRIIGALASISQYSVSAAATAGNLLGEMIF